MIDKQITTFQGCIIKCAHTYVYDNIGRNTGRCGSIALGKFKSRAVMALAIGVTSLIDYVKFPLAAVEELVKGIILIPTIPFSKNLAKKHISYCKYAIHNISLIISKLFLGTINDIKTLGRVLVNPQKVSYYFPPSYYGSKLLYNWQGNENEATDHPSIYY